MPRKSSNKRPSAPEKTGGTKKRCQLEISPLNGCNRSHNNSLFNFSDASFSPIKKRQPVYCNAFSTNITSNRIESKLQQKNESMPVAKKKMERNRLTDDDGDKALTENKLAENCRQNGSINVKKKQQESVTDNKREKVDQPTNPVDNHLNVERNIANYSRKEKCDEKRRNVTDDKKRSANAENVEQNMRDYSGFEEKTENRRIETNDKKQSEGEKVPDKRRLPEITARSVDLSSEVGMSAYLALTVQNASRAYNLNVETGAQKYSARTREEDRSVVSSIALKETSDDICLKKFQQKIKQLMKGFYTTFSNNYDSRKTQHYAGMVSMLAQQKQQEIIELAGKQYTERLKILKNFQQQITPCVKDVEENIENLSSMEARFMDSFKKFSESSVKVKTEITDAIQDLKKRFAEYTDKLSVVDNAEVASMDQMKLNLYEQQRSCITEQETKRLPSCLDKPPVK